ncbi:MAG TPA: hypothetical protein VHW01_06840 [Polyangiaceae bacterium]|nr:hypothetical protein [Polyangiaceae bacterium]
MSPFATLEWSALAADCQRPDADGKSPMPTSDAQTTTYPYEVVFGGGANGIAQDGA